MERENTHAQTEKATIEKLDGLIDGQLENAGYSIKELCDALGVSRSQLFRLVKERSGLSPSRYIRLRRLLRARTLLTDTDWRIVEITDKVGLDSPQTFTKYFTQEFGISPSEYRKKLADRPLETDEVVTGQAPPDRVAAVGPALPEATPSRPRHRWLAGIGLLLLLAAGLYVVLRLNREDGGAPETSVAILPFTYRGDPADSLLAGGLYDQVHASLASLDQLTVISKISSGYFRNSAQAPAEIARDLGVRYLLTGTVTSRARKLQITVELVKAREDRTVWARTFDGSLGQGIGYMNQVARQITEALDRKLSANESRRLNRLPTQNVRAYQEYLRGVHLLKSRSKEKMRAGIGYFDRALALDSTFADALANRGLAYYLLGSDGHMELLKSIQLAEQNALLAIRLDPGNAMAYATLANCYWRLNKPEQALTTFEIALRHGPNDALINYWYSLALRTMGRFDEAIRYGNRALTLDPLYPTIIAGHVGNYSYAGRFDEAWQLIQESEPLLDQFYMYYYVRAFYYLNRQDHRQALREFTKSDSLNPGYQLVDMFMLYCRARLGERAPAEAQLRALTDIPDHYVYKAILYAGLRDKENCLRYLELGAPLGIAPEYLKISPLFRFLHDDPRFQAILRQLGLLAPNP